MFESHPLYFIFLRGHLKISSRRDEAPWVWLLLCAYGPWREVVPHSRLPEAPVVLAPIFSSSSVLSAGLLQGVGLKPVCWN